VWVSKMDGHGLVIEVSILHSALQHAKIRFESSDYLGLIQSWIIWLAKGVSKPLFSHCFTPLNCISDFS